MREYISDAELSARCSHLLYPTRAKEVAANRGLIRYGRELKKVSYHLGLNENSIRVEILQAALKYLASIRENDITYRSRLIARKYKSSPTVGILQEIPVGKSKLDIAFAGKDLKVVEIKTGLDNLTKLKTQVDSYRKISRYVSVVAGGKNLDKLISTMHDGEDLGIYSFGARGGLSEVRPARPNSSFLDKQSILDMLTREDLDFILKKIGDSSSLGLDLEIKRDLVGKLIQDNETLGRHYATAVRSRRSTKIGQKYARHVPPEMIYWGYGKFNSLAQLERVCTWLGEEE